MKKLKILIICDKGFVFGGTEILILNEKEGLIKRGHEVKVFSSDVSNDQVNFGDYTFKGFSENSLIKWFSYVFNFNSYIKLRQVLREYKPDIIHLHNIFYQVSPSVLFAVGNIPTVLTLSSYELICPTGAMIKSDGSRCISPGKHDLRCTGSIKGYLYETIKQFVHKYLLKKIALYIAPSESIKGDFLNQKIISSPITVIHNGIPLMAFSPLVNYKRLLYVGRLSKEKGVEVLLRAMKIIKERMPEIIVDIVGDGPEKNILIKLSNDLNLGNNVRFVGSIPHNKIGDFYKLCTAIIVPSICADNFPTVCIEAMSIGRPIIGSRVGGIPELINDGDTGFLIQPGDSRQLADKVIYLINNLDLIRIMSEKAFVRSRLFSLDEHINSLEQMYKSVIIRSN